MLKRYVAVFVVALTLVAMCGVQSAKAILCIDSQWTGDVSNKLQNDKEQLDIMGQQSEHMQKTIEAIGEGSSGFAKTYLESLELPVDLSVYTPNYPEALEKIKSEFENPIGVQTLIIDVLGLDDEDADRDLQVGEIKGIRSETAMLAAKDAYAVSVMVQTEMASIGDVVDTLANENADTIKGDLGVNTGMVIEMVHQLNTANVLLSSELELEAAMGFIGAPIH